MSPIQPNSAVLNGIPTQSRMSTRQSLTSSPRSGSKNLLQFPFCCWGAAAPMVLIYSGHSLGLLAPPYSTHICFSAFRWWFCWFHQNVIFSVYDLDWYRTECEAAGLRVSTSNSVAMVLSQKTVDYTLQIWGEVQPKAKDLKYFSVFFMSGRWSMRVIGVSSALLCTFMWKESSG